MFYKIINNPLNQNVVDSRELIEYFENIEIELLKDLNNAYKKYCDEGNNIEFEKIEDIDRFLNETIDCEVFKNYYDSDFNDLYTLDERIDDYKTLKELIKKFVNISFEFKHGEIIIKENYFEEYCKTFVKDRQILKNFPSWLTIDWKTTSDNIKNDYSKVFYDDVTYLILKNEK